MISEQEFEKVKDRIVALWEEALKPGVSSAGTAEQMELPALKSPSAEPPPTP